MYKLCILYIYYVYMLKYVYIFKLAKHNKTKTTLDLSQKAEKQYLGWER